MEFFPMKPLLMWRVDYSDVFQFNHIVHEHRRVEGTSLVHSLLFDVMFEPWLATQLKIGDEESATSKNYSAAGRKDPERFDPFEEYKENETVLIVSSTRSWWSHHTSVTLKLIIFLRGQLFIWVLKILPNTYTIILTTNPFKHIWF